MPAGRNHEKNNEPDRYLLLMLLFYILCNTPQKVVDKKDKHVVDKKVRMLLIKKDKHIVNKKVIILLIKKDKHVVDKKDKNAIKAI